MHRCASGPMAQWQLFESQTSLVEICAALWGKTVHVVGGGELGSALFSCQCGICQLVAKEVLGIQGLSQLPELREIEALAVVPLQVREASLPLVEIQVYLCPME